MNWWNGIYLVLTVGVLATLPTQALVLMALCLLPVALLWLWRWVADWRRSKNIAAALSGTEFFPVSERAVLVDVLQAMNPPLRDWVMHGYPTGATQYWVRNAWGAQHDDKCFTAMEVQTTPGYMGTGIPLWRVRHCALIVHSAEAWPEFMLWRDPAAASKSGSGATSQEHRMGLKYQRLPIQGFWSRQKNRNLPGRNSLRFGLALAKQMTLTSSPWQRTTIWCCSGASACPLQKCWNSCLLSGIQASFDEAGPCTSLADAAQVRKNRIDRCVATAILTP